MLIDLMIPADGKDPAGSKGATNSQGSAGSQGPASDKEKTERREKLETAISFAATAIADLCRQGGANLLIGTTATPDRCIVGPASLALLQDVMNELAVVEPHTDDRLNQLLDAAVLQLESQADIILISTAAIDLDDKSRFQKWYHNPARRAWNRWIRTVDVSSSELTMIFQEE